MSDIATRCVDIATHQFVDCVSPSVWDGIEGIAIKVLVVVVLLLLLWIINRFGNLCRWIPNDKVCIVEKKVDWRGRSILKGFIALNGEAGFQPEILRGGLHWFFPFVYRLHIVSLVNIQSGQIGYVYARDGRPLDLGQTLAHNTLGEDFLDVRAFLSTGGQKGPQRQILREGTHAINLAQFVIFTEGGTYDIGLDDIDQEDIQRVSRVLTEREAFTPLVIKGEEDSVAIVTAHDGQPLDSGEIIAPVVGGHNSFQDPESFISNGGRRGRQLQVLAEGTYFINRLFATTELIAKTVIEIGEVGVVVSYTGDLGVNTMPAEFHHGQLVSNGTRGVWDKPLPPGKYAFNTYAGKIETVPTTNFVLKWDAQADFTSHRLDDNLSEISLITKDAFNPILPLSVVLHIAAQKAPELIQRFGNVQRLVEQTLDPMVSSYFKNVGQTKTLIELLSERADIQMQAGVDMKERLSAYSLEFQEVLIGTPRPKPGDETIEQILYQLRQRQIATEQVSTYTNQQQAADKQKELAKAQAKVKIQDEIIQSRMHITVQENMGAAAAAKARKDTEAIEALAEAEKKRRTLEGEGEAAAILAIGTSNAEATQKQVEAYGGPAYRLAEQIAIYMFEAVKEGHQPIVPNVIVSGDDKGAGSIANLLSGVLAGLLPIPDSNPESTEPTVLAK